MSMMQDPKKIADWLIKRAGSSPAARLYIAAISKAKGLLLAPGEQGTTAVSVVADMKAQGVTVREAEAAGTAGAAAPAGAAAKPAVPVVKHGAPGAAAAAAVVAGLNKPAPAAGEGVAPAGAAGEGVAPAGAAGEGVAPAPEAPAGEAAEPAADVDDGANLGSGRRSRKTRHRTPKRKKLSRKKSVKRK